MEPPLHLEAVVHRVSGKFWGDEPLWRQKMWKIFSKAADGLIGVVSSCLTGRVWEGHLWAVESAKEFQSLSNCGLTAARTMAGNSDVLWLTDSLLAVASDCGLLEVWEHTPLGHSLQQLFTLGSHDDMVMSLCHLGESQRIASGSADSRAIVWDVLTHSVIHTYTGHTDCVWCVSGQSANSDVMATSSQDGTIKVWDFRQSIPATKFRESSDISRALCWGHDVDHILAIGLQLNINSQERGGHQVYTTLRSRTEVIVWPPKLEAGETGQVCIFDLRSPNTLLLAYQQHSRAIHRMSFCSTNSGLLATVSNDSKVVVYNVTQNNLQYCSSAHSDFVHGLSWHPTKAELITCGWDGNMLSHDIATVNDHPLTTSLEMSVENEAVN